MTKSEIRAKARQLLQSRIAEYAAKSNPRWRLGNDFDAIKKVEKVLRGEVGEEFLVDMLKLIGCDANRKQGHRGEYDVVLLGSPSLYIEVKTATEDVQENFQFNGIRYDVDYDFLFTVGVAPDNIFFKIYAKNEVPKNLPSMAKKTPGTHKLTLSKAELLSIESFADVAQKKFNL